MRSLPSYLAAFAPFVLVACGGTNGPSLTGDAGATPDTGAHVTPDGGHTKGHDAATKDAPAAHDGSSHHDAVAKDSGHPVDGTSPDDVTSPHDTGAPLDSAPPDDVVVSHDSAVPHDAATPQDSGVNNPSCPTTAPTGDCAQPHLACDYPPVGNTAGSACICSNGAPPMAMMTWHCTALAEGCPTQPPAVGSACSNANLICDYGACIGGEKVKCTNGAWATQNGVCPP